MTRKLASIRRIAEMKNIPDADLIQAYRVDGWWVVGKKSEFSIGDLVCYIEVDAWVPTEIAPFLSKGKEPREFNGIKGERLRTVKLKKQLSQGLILPLSIIPETWDDGVLQSNEDLYQEGEDVTEKLGIQLFEKPLSAQLSGRVRGNFPHFIPKTDQERIQNLKRDFEKYKENGLIFEVTEKLDGSSMTVYYKDGVFGVCSRNLDLEEDENNSFWSTARKYNLEEKLRTINEGQNIAIQGELIGPGIQGNPYNLAEYAFHVFDVWDIDNQKYYCADERITLTSLLDLNHCPMVSLYYNLNPFSIDDVLAFAENKSQLNANTEREGLVFKCISDPSISFKAISNKFLLGEK